MLLNLTILLNKFQQLLFILSEQGIIHLARSQNFPKN